MDKNNINSEDKKIVQTDNANKQGKVKKIVGALKILGAALVSAIIVAGYGIKTEIVMQSKELYKQKAAELNNPIYELFAGDQFDNVLEKSKSGGEFSIDTNNPAEVKEYITKIRQEIINKIISDCKNTDIEIDSAAFENPSTFEVILNYTRKKLTIKIAAKKNLIVTTYEIGKIKEINFGGKNPLIEIVDSTLNNFKIISESKLAHVKLKLPAYVHEIVMSQGAKETKLIPGTTHYSGVEDIESVEIFGTTYKMNQIEHIDAYFNDELYYKDFIADSYAEDPDLDRLIDLYSERTDILDM